MGGARPTGPKVAFASPPAEVVTLLESELAPPPPPATPPGQGQRWALAAGLLALGAAAWAVDRSLGYRPGAFSLLVPFSWLGTIVVLRAGRREQPGRLGLGALFAMLGLVLLGGFLGLPFLAGHGASNRGVPVALMGILLVLYGRLEDRRERPLRPPDRSHRIRPWAEALAVLADDALPGEPAPGHLDLSGSQQPDKLLRTKRATSGAKICFYRDEWWRARVSLADGSQLRLSGVDRVKERESHWKQGRSRRKLKPGRSERLMTIEAQLTPNPDLYRTRPSDGKGRQLGALQATPLVVEKGRVSAVARLAREDELCGADVLALVAFAFSALERVEAARP